MFVVKRDGRKEEVHFDKITSRIKKLCYGLRHVDPVAVSKHVCTGVYPGVKTSDLDELAAETAAHMASQHHEYGILAARIATSNLHKNTVKSFSQNFKRMHEYVDKERRAPLVDDVTADIVARYAHRLDSAIVYSRDFNYSYFGFKTLTQAYLRRMHGKLVERPQHMLMRVAVGIHGEDLESVLQAYEYMSQSYYTHASPTLFHAGTPKPGMSSCFLIDIKDDSVIGIYETLSDCARISKMAGGIGLAVHTVRAAGTYIAGTNGTSNGLVPMLRVFNNTARYIDQGGNRRKGSFAIYLEPWHADIFDFLDLKKMTGPEELRAKDLFYGLWICDLFMKRVEKDGDWSLMCPHECPGLADVYGDEFEALYCSYEAESRVRKTIKARELWKAIYEAQVESGAPYILFKDAVNRKNNQKNLGTIKSSNLCTEICEFTDPSEIAVCNLASLALPKFMEDGKFDHQKLFQVTQFVTRSLNRVIDRNHYDVPETQTSNMKHRPIGIGVQGLANVFQRLRMPFTSPEARTLNKEIFETMYFAALTASCALAEEQGPYESFPGSPASQGILQYHMWGVEPSARWDWSGLIQRIQAHGLRNSLLLALMPTASTSQILGNTEAFEPVTSNIYLRRTLAGEFTVVNNDLIDELNARQLWNPAIRARIIAAGGSVQNIMEIPADVRAVFKTVWEIPGKELMEMSADRAPFIDQSQSFNIFMKQPDYQSISSSHFHAWRLGLKTGMYYLRTREVVKAQSVYDGQVTAVPLTAVPLVSAVESGMDEDTAKKLDEEQLSCSMEDGCVSCGS